MKMKIHVEVVLTAELEPGENLVPIEEWPDEIRDLFEGWDVEIIKLEKVE